MSFQLPQRKKGPRMLSLEPFSRLAERWAIRVAQRSSDAISESRKPKSCQGLGRSWITFVFYFFPFLLE
jgi:hypothetical protein